MNHPITPPPELVEQWTTKYVETACSFTDIANEIARWGWDQRGTANEAELQEARDEELAACCEWFQEFYKTESWVTHDLKHFRAARRPKPPTLKEQALDELTSAERLYPADWSSIRKALEALPE
jgi:hypothetical protein